MKRLLTTTLIGQQGINLTSDALATRVIFLCLAHLRGMLSTWASLGCCTTAMPPKRLTLHRTDVPSSSAPERMTPS